jgi:hypothetical protein
MSTELITLEEKAALYNFAVELKELAKKRGFDTSKSFYVYEYEGSINAEFKSIAITKRKASEESEIIEV